MVALRVLGIDFTSRPTRQKPLTCLPCVLENDVLEAQPLKKWDKFEDFERALREPGPWITGIDFPFGQSRKFITNMGWPLTWNGYVTHAQSLGQASFYNALTAYRSDRPYGDREHQRETDRKAKSISPQKLHGVPVARMFFQGAPRLIEAGVTIPGLQVGDPDRIVVEAYPKMLVSKFADGKSYKSDTRKKQTQNRSNVRRELLKKIIGGACLADYGLKVIAPESLAEDPTGDQLDALLCAIQAAWSWSQREKAFGAPSDFDQLEGWIADPYLLGKAAPRTL
ncbi:MAG TPA: DUF429 domain-containing protein [Xanthobacteraceae bacterium]|jgi:hypothetical protein|nr:DUF429 domain-containing protein [Xanthobacteraceae bacterium]